MRIPLVLLVAVAAPLHGQATPAATARAAVLAADRALAAEVGKAGLGAALPAALAPNGVVLWPAAAVVRGPVAARLLLAAQPDLAAARFAWQPLHVEIAGDSTLALLWGVMVLQRPAAAPAAAPRIGRFLAAWRRGAAGWQLEAWTTTGVVTAAEGRWVDSIGVREWPALPGRGATGPFVVADSSFAASAGRSGAAAAFRDWAAPDAVTFSGNGELNMGKPAIFAWLSGGDPADWKWTPVAAGASTDGSLGWTVGQSLITPKSGDASKGKYLTLWRRMPDGTIRFIADGGNARP